ncbi:hypothetical protein Ais01nite_37920 [Asanoa ishikariensis]|uniref:Uncharacterized protein n=1 Tax=Asanoa ishikariensis TaxID=137265 RepID=A0A1H3LXY6_9ACTN|nr:hypothetical protein [Asanoa ishikariensis]GIF65757.1 hypothetical protein Ais01nite_37920 [Asanoa ishikariensis]SDY68899.1 hypothetical protein SAMN05421684_1030 [Asanoa ishikariensis]
MRARLFGRWAGRAAIFAVLGLGALVAGGVASAQSYIDHAEVQAVGEATSGAMVKGALASLAVEWN